MLIPSDVKDFARIVSDAGFQIYLVGGAVRNIKMGLCPEDYDFTTNASPQQIMGLFKRVIPTGIDHGTVTVLFRDSSFEITTYRIDGKYNDSRHPESVAFSNDIYEDLKRRDFTINAMALDVLTGNLIDAHGGVEDLKKGIIRAIGNPEERFAEDGLRILRACRFACQMNFQIEPETLKGMKSQRKCLEHISSERIRDEILKIMKGDRPSVSFLYMKESDVMQYVLPELLEGDGMEQRERHKFDVFHHNLFACDFMEKSPVLRMAALLHDIGKPRCLKLKDGIPTFYCHEKVSSEMAHDILHRLKFPKADENHICQLIENHMFNYTGTWTDGAVRRFVAKVGKENIPDLFKLRFADRAGSVGSITYACTPEDIAFARRIEEIIKDSTALTLKDLEINGDVLFREAGVPKGRSMGTVLNYLLEAVMEDPEMNCREKLINLGRNFYQNRINIK